MPDIIKCPHCRRTLQMPEQFIGRLIECPRCEKKFNADPVELSPNYVEVIDDSLPLYTPHRGTKILVIGILSLFCFGPVLGPIAWVMGSNDLREIRAGRMNPDGKSQTRAGQICGMIATIYTMMGIILFAVIAVIIQTKFRLGR